MMSLSKESPPPKKREHILEFSDEFGDLSPIDDFRGPRTPSRRQVLRHVLFWIEGGKNLKEAANEVVPRLLQKHSCLAAGAKSPRRLSEDIISLYKYARLISLFL